MTQVNLALRHEFRIWGPGVEEGRIAILTTTPEPHPPVRKPRPTNHGETRMNMYSLSFNPHLALSGVGRGALRLGRDGGGWDLGLG